MMIEPSHSELKEILISISKLIKRSRFIYIYIQLLIYKKIVGIIKSLKIKKNPRQKPSSDKIWLTIKNGFSYVTYVYLTIYISYLY